MPTLQLPPDVEAVFREFRTCEFTTVNKQGAPITWPMEPFYDHAAGHLIVTSSIAFAVKAQNARRHPQVSLFFSDPTDAPLTDPPAVLVQGTVTVSELTDDPPWSYEMFRESVLRQPRTRGFVANPLARKLFEFQFQRLALIVTPSAIYVWPHRDFSQVPEQIEVRHVE